MRKILWSCLLLIACSDQPTVTEHDGSIHAIIEIPAGTNDKLEYDHHLEEVVHSTRDGVPRTIAYLPYPANYGFIEGTMMRKENGGDGDPLDVFVICPSLPSGTLIAIQPVGVIETLDEGEKDDKVIAIPKDEDLRTIHISDLKQVPDVVTIITTWLKNYDPQDETIIVAVHGPEKALAAIDHWANDH